MTPATAGGAPRARRLRPVPTVLVVLLAAPVVLAVLAARGPDPDGPGRPAAMAAGPGPPVAAEPDATAGAASVPTVLLVLLVLITGVAVGWLWRERGRRPLREAFALLQRDDEESWHGGAAMLTGLLPRLRPEQAAEASFGLAYARARLGELRDAATILDDLSRAGTRDRAVLHLDLWVKVKLRRYEDAARSWQDVAEEQLRDLEQSRQLAGIAILALAREALARRDVDEALHRFTQLRGLGVLTDRIPDSVTDHRIMVGVERLRNEEFGQARVSFSKAEDAAGDDQESALLARLGLLLCDWRARRAPDADFHRRLGEVVEEVRSRARPGPPGQERLLRDLLLWRAVACVAGWRNLAPPSGGLPAEERNRLAGCLRAVREADPELPDPDLIGGLVGLFLRTPGEERAVANALEVLGRACDNGVTLPAVLHLLEANTAAGATDGVQEHLALVRNYLADARVPLSLRWRLRDHLLRFERVQRLLEEDVRGADREYAPSLPDLLARGQLLHERISTLVLPTLAALAPDHAEQVTAMAQELDRTIRSLREQADAFTALEQRLILLTGQFLLQDEPVGPPQ